MHFGYECLRLSTVQHEFMHALGVVHEQTNTNRDEYLFVNETVIEAIDTRGVHNYQKINKSVQVKLPYPFELDSLLMYSPKVYDPLTGKAFYFCTYIINQNTFVVKVIFGYIKVVIKTNKQQT